MTEEIKFKWRPTYPIPIIIKALQKIPSIDKKIKLINMLIEDCKYNEENITQAELEEFKRQAILDGMPDAKPASQLPFLYDLLEKHKGYKDFKTYRTYDFEPEAIEIILTQIDSKEQKLNRLWRLKKDIEQLIAVFESDDIFWDVYENGGTATETRYPELNEFISEQVYHYKENNKVISRKAIQGEITIKYKEYRRKLKWIASEIEFWENTTNNEEIDTSKNGAKSSAQNTRSKNYDREIEKYIKATFRFYRKPENHGKHPDQKYYAKKIGFSETTLSNRLTKTPKFINRMITIINEWLDHKFAETPDGRTLSPDEQDILLHLLYDMKDRQGKLERQAFTVMLSKEKLNKTVTSKEGEALSSQSSLKASTMSDKASHKGEYGGEKEDYFSELDAPTKIERVCNNCGKNYDTYIVEDDDFNKWENQAMEKPELFRRLVCSEECYRKLLTSRGIDPKKHPSNFN